MAARAEIASSPAPAAVTPGAALPLRSGVRLRALVLIRWAAVAGQLLTAAVVHWGLGFTLPVLAVGGAIALSALLNLTVSLGRPASARIDDRERCRCVGLTAHERNQLPAFGLKLARFLHDPQWNFSCNDHDCGLSAKESCGQTASNG